MKLLNKLFSFFFLITLVNVGNGFAQNPTYLSSVTQNLKTPVRIAFDKLDKVYVTDAKRKLITKYDVYGNYMDAISPSASPISIAINAEDKIFIGDGETGNILKINPDGSSVVIYTGTQFPSDMTCCPDGNLYIVDSKLKQVIVIDESGNLIRTIGSTNLFYPVGIAYNPKNNRVLITEHGGLENDYGIVVEKVWMYGLAGNLIGSFGLNGSTNGKFYRIQGLSVDRCGNIYVPDPFQGNVSVFSENGVFISKFGVWGGELGKLNIPLDIAINSKDSIWMTSMNNGALEIYKIHFSLPTSNITSSSVKICNGDSTEIPIHFTGTPPWSFTYTINGLSSSTINNVTSNPYIISANQGGTYQITALSDSSKTGTCFSGTPTITVDSIIPSSNMTSGVNTICSGDSTNIPISLTGTAPWSLTYTIGGLNPTRVDNITVTPYQLTVTQAGTYQVTDISGVGCRGSIITGSATINLNPSTTYAYAASICDATSYTLGTQTLTTSGIYTENFTSSNGCDSVVTLTLNIKPQISEVQEATICNATSITFGTQTLSSGGIYTENFIAANGCDSLVTLTLIVAPAISEEITATTCEGSPFTFGSQTLSNAGTYTETFTSAAGCDSVVLLNLNVNSLSTATISSGNENICTGGTANISIDFTGVPPWNFTYTIDNTSPATITYVSDNPYILPVTQAGTYALTYLTGAGCIGTTNPLNAVITIYPTININATDSVCNNSSYVFGTQTLTTTGVYNELFVSSNGCDSTVTLDLTVVAEPVPQYTFNSTGLVVTFVNSTLNADTFSWNFGDGNTSTLPNPVYTYGTPGLYIVDLSASNTFCGTVTFSDTVNLLALPTSSNFNENSVKIYPNPTSGNITIECGNAFQSEITIDIFSVTGQKIYTSTFDSKNKNQKVNLSAFANGMYTIKILTSNFVKTDKIILNR